MRALELKEVRTAPQCPWQNPYAERVIGTLRREILDHVIVLGENHLRRIVSETLAYYDFPQEHWRRIRTNNPLERVMKEIRRRTRVVGAFPDGESALMLVAARLRHIVGTKWGMKRYLNMNHLRDVALAEASEGAATG